MLISCNQMSADYLFQRDKHYDVCYDTGDKVIQCGRHNDIFKFWLQWRSRVSFFYSFSLILRANRENGLTHFFVPQGMSGFERQIERLMELTAYQVSRMKELGEKFYLLNDEPECTNVIFWYVPERLRPRQCPQYGTRDWQLELGTVSGTFMTYRN